MNSSPRSIGHRLFYIWFPVVYALVTISSCIFGRVFDNGLTSTAWNIYCAIGVPYIVIYLTLLILEWRKPGNSALTYLLTGLVWIMLLSVALALALMLERVGT